MKSTGLIATKKMESLVLPEDIASKVASSIKKNMGTICTTDDGVMVDNGKIPYIRIETKGGREREINKLNIKDIVVDAEEVFAIPVWTGQVLKKMAPYDQGKGYGAILCASPDKNRGWFNRTCGKNKDERNKEPWCTDCKSCYMVGLVLTDKEGIPILDKDTQEGVTFLLEGRGMKYMPVANFFKDLKTSFQGTSKMLAKQLSTKESPINSEAIMPYYKWSNVIKITKSEAEALNGGGIYAVFALQVEKNLIKEEGGVEKVFGAIHQTAEAVSPMFEESIVITLESQIAMVKAKENGNMAPYLKWFETDEQKDEVKKVEEAMKSTTTIITEVSGPSL